MKSIPTSITIIVCILLFCSCYSSKSLNNEQTSDNKSLNNEQTSDNNTISLEFKSSSVINIKNTVAKITLFGYNPSLADVAATIICQKEIRFNKPPFSVTLEIPLNPEELIHPKVFAKENAKYYLVFYCDNNRNNIDDQGDIKNDYTNGVLPKVDVESKESQIFYIKEY